MIERTSNIDLVFRNGLKEFEILPPQDVWDDIKPSLNKKSQSALYLRAASLAGLIVAGGALTLYLSDSLSENFNGPAITMNQDLRPEGRYNPSVSIGSIPIMSAAAVNEPIPMTSEGETVKSDLSFHYRLPETGLITSTAKKSNILSFQKNRAIAANSTFNSPVIIPYRNDVVLHYDIPEYVAETTHENRWSLGASVTPTYYSKISSGSSDQEKTLAASENAAMSYSGGMSVAFRINRRFSLQMGVYFNSLNEEIDGVKTYSGLARYYTVKGTDNFTVATTNGTIVSKNNDIFLTNSDDGTRVTSFLSKDVFDPGKAGLTYLTNSVYQNFSYLEVPFVFRYKFIDRTIGMNLIGGISYNQLLNNSAYTVAGGNKYFIGSIEGLYPVTLSSSLGVGMEYNLSKRLSVNLEPTFKYFITPMGGQSSSSMHPYTFGIFSGVSWKF